MYKVLLLTRYSRLGASSRTRFHQYVPYLDSTGIEVTCAPLLDDDYLVRRYSGSHMSTLSLLRTYLRRICFMRRAKQFDVVWVEKEMLPWILSPIELGLFPANVPLVVDYDDAMFHQYGRHRHSVVRTLLGGKIDAVMSRADLVIAGNDYLAEHARRSGARRVELLPTVVDITRYEVIPSPQGRPLTIGWIGSPATAPYLHHIEHSLREITSSRNVRIVAVGAYPSQLHDLPIEVRPWSEGAEAAEIQQFDIGIMPLPDGGWERGKCAYKLIQYMACGKPVVASPVGMNNVVVRHGVEGFLARTEAEWNNALTILGDDASLRWQMGAAGRALVESEYCLQITGPRVAKLLKSVVIRN